MDPNFAFPRTQVPTLRPPRQAHPHGANGNRDSNALRASVLDVALQLGLGTNHTVANWMFNNPLEEEDEERSPALTHGSTATSDDSQSPTTVFSPHADNVRIENSEAFDFMKPMGVGNPPAALSTSMGDVKAPRATTPTSRATTSTSRAKLRKKRTGGYESDGAYISEAARKKDTKKDAKGQAKSDDGVRVRSKSLFGSNKSKRNQQDDKESSAGHGTGYETDSPSLKFGSKSKAKKSKSKAAEEMDYETDSGYLSSSSWGKKSRFFSLRTKKSKQELKQDVPPLPLPSSGVKADLPLPPIASKFATSLSPNPTPSPSLTAASSIMHTAHSNASPSSFLSLTPASSPSPTAVENFSTPPPTSPEQSFQRDTALVPHGRDSSASEEPGPLSSSLHHQNHGASSAGHSSEWHEEKHGIRSENFSNPTSTSSPVITRSATAPAGQILSSSPQAMTISSTLSETTLTAISPRASANLSRPVVMPFLVPSIRPGEIFKLPEPTLPTTVANDATLVPQHFQPLSVPQQRQQGPASLSALPPKSPETSSVPLPRPSARPRPRFPPTDGFGPRLPAGPHSAKLMGSVAKKTVVFTGVPPSPPSESETAGSQALQQRQDEQSVARSEFEEQRQPTLQPPRGLSPGQWHLPRSPWPPAATIASSQPFPLRQPHSQSHLATQPLKVQPRARQSFMIGEADPKETNWMQSRSESRSPVPLPPASPLVIPSEEYVVPSPGASPLPSPNLDVLAYYDIPPPPSPPPLGPLPATPGSYNAKQASTRERGMGRLSGLRNAISYEAVRPSQQQQQRIHAGQDRRVFTQPGQSAGRGRVSPFPHRPVLPPDFKRVSQVQDEPKPESREKVSRYRDPSAFTGREGFGERWRQGGRQVPTATSADTSRSGSLASEDEDEDDMQDVLARFEGVKEGKGMEEDKALGRSRSFEAIRRIAGYNGKEEEALSDDEEGDDRWYGRKSLSEEDGGGDRNNRWSGSIYSRASFLDPDKSEETRERFMRKVEEIYLEDGRERGAVPPVPKIPDTFAASPAKSWNRF